MEEDSLFPTQADLILRGIDLVADRSAQLEKEVEGMTTTDIDVAVRIFRIRSLRYYEAVLRYLATTVRRNEQDVAVFLLPNIRTLQDIFARLVHLEVECATEEDRAKTCIAYMLYSQRNLVDGELYANLRKQYDPFLKAHNIVIADSADKVDIRALDRQHLTFKSNKKLLTRGNMLHVATYTTESFRGKELYTIFSYFSEVVHGNPYVYNEEEVNEKFWVVAMCHMNTAFLIELIDRFALRKSLPTDFRKWLSDINQSFEPFYAEWSARRAKLQKKRHGFRE